MPINLPKYPLINGNRPDWAAIEFTPQLGDGTSAVVVGLKSLNYKAEQDPTDVMGTSPLPIATTKGTAKFSGDVEMYLAEFQALADAIGDGFGTVPITITVSYSEGDYTRTDTLVSCRLISPEASQSQGADALTRKFSLKMLNILWGGVAAVKPSF